MADDLLLDDAEALLRADRRGRLRTAALAGAHVRRALDPGDDDAVARAAAEGRPRALLVVGDAVGVGSLVTALARAGAPVPVVVADADRVPGWVGALDLVVTVGVTGREAAVLTATEEAARRGARVVVVAPAGSPLAAAPVPHDGGGVVPVHVEPDAADGAASLWSLAVPVLRLADRLGLVDAPDAALAAAADRLDEVAVAAGPVVPLVANPAKILGLGLAESSPVVWGSGPAGIMAAARLAARLAAEAGVPARAAPVLEARESAAGLFSGPLARPADVDDVFRDRVDDPDTDRRLRVVLLRDAEESGPEQHLVASVTATAERRDVPVSSVVAEGDHAVARVAELAAVADWAAVYAGLALAVDAREVDDQIHRAVDTTFDDAGDP